MSKKLSDVGAWAEARVEEFVSRLVLELAQEQTVAIRQRVKRGIGSSDQPMRPYSEAYREFKQEKGRQVEVRDLTFTGRMLGSIYAKPAGLRRAVITFADSAAIEKAKKNQKISAWWGISPSDLKILRAKLDAIIQAMNTGGKT